MKVLQAILATTLVLSTASFARADEGAGRSEQAAAPSEDDESIREKASDRISKNAAKFRGSIFLFDQSITPDTLDHNAQLSAVPSYQWWMSLRPRYYIRKDVSVRMRLDLTIEWTNGGSDTTLARQALIGDLWTEVAYTPKKFFGIQSSFTLRAVWGTSLEARGDTSVARVGPALSLARPITTKIGEFEPTLGMYTLYNFVNKTSAGVQHGYQCTSTDFTPTSCGQDTGLMNSQVSFVAALGLRYSPHPKVGINANYIILDSWAYHVPGATVTDATGGTTNVPLQGDTRFRQSSWFLASIDYDPKPWLSLSLGYYTLRSIRDPDGHIGDPFYQAGGRTRVFFTTTFNIDKVYESAARAAEKKKAAAAQAKAALAAAKLF